MRSIKKGIFICFIILLFLPILASSGNELGGIINEPNVAVDSLNCILVGQSDLDGFGEDVFVLDEIAYIAGGSQGIQIIDISYPIAPIAIGSYSTGPTEYALSIFVQHDYDEDGSVKGTYAYVAYENEGFIVLDVSDPTTPINVFQEKSTVGNVAKAVYVDNDYVYLATLDKIKIYDISWNPSDPVLLRTFNTTSAVHGIFALKDYIYLAYSSGKLVIVDVTNIANPVQIGSFTVEVEIDVSPWSIHVVNNLAYLYVWGYGLIIIDVSDKTEPERIGFYDQVGEWESDIFVIEPFVYIPEVDQGLKIIDVSDPTTPIETAFYENSSSARSVYVIDNLAYMVSFKFPQLSIIEHLRNGYIFDLTYYPEMVNYNQPTTLNVNLKKDYADESPFQNANVYLEDINGQIISEIKTPDINGNVVFEILKTDILPIYLVAENSITPEQIERYEIKVDYHEMTVTHPSEISAFKNEVFDVSAHDLITGDPVPNLSVIINLPDGEELEVKTNTLGIALFNILTGTEGVATVEIPSLMGYISYSGNFDVIINYSEYSVNHISSIYGYKNETFDISVTDIHTGEPLQDLPITVSLPDGQELEVTTNIAGIAICDIYTKTEGTANIDIPGAIISSVVYSDYSSSFDIVINEMIVEHTDDLGVLREGDIQLSVKQGPIYPENLEYISPPLIDATVSISNELDISYSGITGSTGIITTNGNTSYTKKIDIEVTKETYRTYTETIEPYMWSNDKNAFGKNNQNNILRKTNTNSMYMVYSDGDSIVYGYSDNFGEYWYVEKIGKGQNPTLVKTEAGLIAMWSGLQYSVLSSPWTPVDTSFAPVLWSSEPTLTGAKSSVNKYGSYIGHRNLNIEKGDLIFGKWLDKFISYIELDTVFRYDGSDGIIPMASPIVSAYMKLETESYLIGCISTDNEYIVKLWDPNFEQWEFRIWRISLTDQIAMSPSVNFDEYNTTFVWEVEEDINTKDIWERKLSPTGFTNAQKISCTNGINTYPVNKDDILYSYVNNGNKLIGYRDGFSSPEMPNSYEVYTSSDSIHSIDVNTKKRQIETDVLYAFTEGKNGNYRIKFIDKTYGGEVWPIVVTPPTDTSVIDAVSSPISDYTNSSFPVERLSFTAPVFDPDMSYLVKIITDDKNPHIPQIVMIDGEVVEVIYGDNEEIITTIEVPQLLTENGSITISIDRKKGNTNRNTEIQIYDYETDEEEVEVASLNKIVFNKPQTLNANHQTNLAINFNTSTMDLFYSIPNDLNIKINIFDITGRVVEQVYNGIQTKGNYTYRLNNKTAGIYFAVMEAEGQIYKAKIVNIR